MMTNDEGTPGPRGAEGAAGARGADGAEGARGSRGGIGERGAGGERGQRGAQSNATRLQLAIVFAVVVLAFALLAWRTETQQAQIDRNTHRLADVVHRQCLVAADSNRRQADLIDTAIAAERRRPQPDRKRIRDLTEFKPTIVDCD